MQSKKMTKRQHYVPRYYLRRFADSEERLWVFDQERSITFRSKFEDVCVRNYHYEIKASRERDWHGCCLLPGKIENRLSKLESDQANLLRCIDRKIESNGHVNTKEQRALKWLIGHLIARHPVMLEGYEPDY